jgi:hypothetical protein
MENEYVEVNEELQRVIAMKNVSAARTTPLCS